jgi:lycopene cyclase domain-containing protein
VTYADLALVFLAGAVALAVASGLLARPSWLWWRTSLVVAALLLVMTVVFDSVMIAVDLFDYGASALLGPRLLLVPVEDLAWPLVAVLVLPALWELLGLLPARGREAARGDE